MTGTWMLALADIRSATHRRWLLVVTAIGIVAIGVVAALAFGSASGLARTDRWHAGVAGVVLLVGLLVAMGLGATALSRDGDSGFFGMLHVAGARREVLAIARVLARVAELAVVIAVWALTTQIGSLALGLGLDGPLAVHLLTMSLNLAIVALVAAAASAIVGRGSSSFLALVTYVGMQSFSRLGNAADQHLIVSWGGASQAIRTILPRFITSPLITDLQNRGKGGPVAPRDNVGGAVALAHVSNLSAILWTLLWCATLAALAVNGMRRRAL